MSRRVREKETGLVRLGRRGYAAVAPLVRVPNQSDNLEQAINFSAENCDFVGLNHMTI